MIITVNSHEFMDRFNTIRPKQFSYDALSELYNYLTQLEDATNEEIELDVIGLCCEWVEDTLINTLRDYDLKSLEELQNNTTVLELDNGKILYQSY